MAAIATLADLMTEAADSACHILSLLPLASLATLQCTCRQLRTVVARQPESLWKAGLCVTAVAPSCTAAETTTRLQAAAERESPAHHPVLQAPSVREYLRQRHIVARNIPTKTYTCTPLEVEPGSALSPDFSLLARLGILSRLQIWNVGAQQLVRQWDLPHAAYLAQGQLLWCQGPGTGCHVVLTYEADPRAQAGYAPAGVIFVNAHSGVRRDIALGPSHLGIRLFASSCGTHVAAVHRGALSVYSSAGALVAHLKEPELPGHVSCCSWAPAALALAVSIVFDGLWVWNLSASTLVRVAGARAWGAWATPAADCLLVGSQGLFSQHNTRMQHTTSLQLPSGTTSAVWGERLALLVRQDPGYEVHICGQDGQPEHVLALGPWLFVGGLHLAGNGELCAGIVGLEIKAFKPVTAGGPGLNIIWPTVESLSRPESLLQRGRLVIIHLASHRLVMLPLPQQLADNASFLSVQWSPACDAVLVLTPRGRMCSLFSFRG